MEKKERIIRRSSILFPRSNCQSRARSLSQPRGQHFYDKYLKRSTRNGFKLAQRDRPCASSIRRPILQKHDGRGSSMSAESNVTQDGEGGTRQVDVCRQSSKGVLYLFNDTVCQNGQLLAIQNCPMSVPEGISVPIQGDGGSRWHQELLCAPSCRTSAGLIIASKSRTAFTRQHQVHPHPRLARTDEAVYWQGVAVERCSSITNITN